MRVGLGPRHERTGDHMEPNSVSTVQIPLLLVSDTLSISLTRTHALAHAQMVPKSISDCKQDCPPTLLLILLLKLEVCVIIAGLWRRDQSVLSVHVTAMWGKHW